MPATPASQPPFPGGLSPLEAAARVRHLPGPVFFDAALPSPRSATPRVAACPVEIVSGATEAEWAHLRARLAAGRERSPEGFAAGWVDYEGGFTFAFYDSAILFPPGQPPQWVGAPLPAELAAALAQPAPPTAPPPQLPPFTSEMGREAYLRAVEAAQEYIAAGDIYQVNLTHRFATPHPGDREALWALYEALRAASPAPHAAWLALEGRTVLSSSPELFLDIRGGRVCTRPIKGTRPRGSTPKEDARLAGELAASAKERAELVMITDLLRNDLGRVCRYGSVEVTGLLELETYAQVFHLVSTVEGELEVDAVAALRACSPGGSITGAPKKRAMEIISELEQRQRGLYTGAIGWLGYDGSAHFSIAIRTLVAEGGTLSFDVGAGIVADSEPAREWEETLHKAAGILRAAHQNTNGTPRS